MRPASEIMRLAPGYARRRMSRYVARPLASIAAYAYKLPQYAVKYPLRSRCSYNTDYFTVRRSEWHREMDYYERGMIRPEDMGAAALYSVGVTDYATVERLMNGRKDRYQQAQAIRDGMSRTPKLVFDVGSGRGDLSAILEYVGIRSVPIDFSAGARDTVDRTYREWFGLECNNFVNKPSYEGMVEAMRRFGDPDTVVFCESAEHIPAGEFRRAFELAARALERTRGLLVITNYMEFHPIVRDRLGWDHVQAIDDSLYDRLAARASRTVFRRGSHLVLGF